METTIPFGGFYCSWHDQELDNLLEIMFSNEHGECNKKLCQRAYDVIPWAAVHLAYAQAYVKAFAEKFSLPIKFKMMCSPKYYNYETDRIIGEIDYNDFISLYLKVDKEALQALIKRRFTSCDGFISHYSNDLADWPQELENWDHNHIGTVLECYIAETANEDWELYLLENLSDKTYNILSEHVPTRLFKIRDYLTNKRNI